MIVLWLAKIVKVREWHQGAWVTAFKHIPKKYLGLDYKDMRLLLRSEKHSILLSIDICPRLQGYLRKNVVRLAVPPHAAGEQVWKLEFTVGINFTEALVVLQRYVNMQIREAEVKCREMDEYPGHEDGDGRNILHEFINYFKEQINDPKFAYRVQKYITNGNN